MDTIAEGLWEARHDIRLPGGIVFDSRMSVADLGAGELLIHSPVPIDDDLARAIEAKGEVRWIVAPNDLHHTFLPAAVGRFPDASVWGSPGARKKHPEVEFDGALEEGAPEEWSSVEAVHVEGTRGWAETVFLLDEQRTLLCSDLVFNVRQTANLRTKWLLKLVRAHGRLAQSASVRWLFTRDRARVGRAFARILAWDFDRLVMGHGEIVESGGAAALAPLLRWAVDDQPRALAS